MVRRTPHGEERHNEPDRPTSEAARDKAIATEIYRDVESGYYIFISARGRAHVFTLDGLHHTSFRTTISNRVMRQSEDIWERIERSGLPDILK